MNHTARESESVRSTQSENRAWMVKLSTRIEKNSDRLQYQSILCKRQKQVFVHGYRKISLNVLRDGTGNTQEIALCRPHRANDYANAREGKR
jgi:hypothetical protein